MGELARLGSKVTREDYHTLLEFGYDNYKARTEKLEADLEATQEHLWSAEAEYKRKLDTSAVGTELTWEEVARFMWEQIREALAVGREE